LSVRSPTRSTKRFPEYDAPWSEGRDDFDLFLGRLLEIVGKVDGAVKDSEFGVIKVVL
jgi:hypothetical protein